MADQDSNQHSTHSSKSGKSLVKSAVAMAFGTLSSRVLGLVRDIVISAQFTAVTTDAWFVAFKIPNLLRRVFGEGAFSAAFIPQFIDKLQNEGEERARLFASSVFTILFVVLLVLSVGGILFAEDLIHPLVNGKGFTEIPGKIEATIRYARIMFFFLFFICIYAFFMAQLNSFKMFFWPAFAPVFFNLSLIIFALLPTTWVSLPGDLLSYGVLVGGFLQMALLIPPLYRRGYFPRLRFVFSDPSIKAVFRNMLPGVVTIGILQFTNLINVRFASQLENGANSWIYYADRLLELPLSLISVSLGTAMLPSLAEAVSKKHWKTFEHQFNQSMKFALFLSVPCAMTLYFLSQEMVATLFMRGEFGPYDMRQTALVLEIYGIALVFYTLLKIINAAFYSMKYYWLPTGISFFILVIHIILVSQIIEAMGLRGIAASTAASSAIGMSILYLVFSFKFPNFSFKEVFGSLIKITFCSLMMVMTFSIYPVLGSFLLGNEVGRVLCLVVTLLLGGGVYISLAKLMGLAEANELVAMVRRRLKR